MTTETMMTEAATTTEGAVASQPATEQTATGAGDGSQQQPVTEVKDQAAQSVAPEKYEFVAPEGQEFDSTVIAEYSAVAKELNLSQESAQKMLDRLAPAMQKKQEIQLETVKTDWANQAKSDKEFGGEKITENLAVAKKALDAFGSPELRELLEQTGLGNNPEIIRAFYRAGKAISEDGFVRGNGNNASPKDARSLYSASNMNP